MKTRAIELWGSMWSAAMLQLAYSFSRRMFFSKVMLILNIPKHGLIFGFWTYNQVPENPYDKKTSQHLHLFVFKKVIELQSCLSSVKPASLETDSCEPGFVSVTTCMNMGL